MRNDGDNGRRDFGGDSDGGGRDAGTTETAASKAHQKQKTMGENVREERGDNGNRYVED